MQLSQFFSQHKILSGTKAMEQIPMELFSFNAVKPLVITDKVSSESGIIKHFVKAMYDSNLVIGGIYDAIIETSGMNAVYDCEELYRARGCDSIIGIGGGAVMNIAKGLNIALTENTRDIMKFSGEGKLSKIMKPLFYIPTARTAGLEAANRAEIERHHFLSDFLFPDTVCIDPRMVKGCCAECVADSALIALTQAIESSAEPHHTPMNDAYAHPAIQFVAENIKKGTRKPKDRQASMSLANAALLAGITFSNSPTGVVYALGDTISTLTGIKKGICMGVLLPHHLDLKIKNKQRIREELLLSLTDFDTYAVTPKAERVPRALERINRLMDDLKGMVPKKLGSLIIGNYKLDEMVARTIERYGKQVKASDCRELLNAAY